MAVTRIKLNLYQLLCKLKININYMLERKTNENKLESKMIEEERQK